MALVFGSVIAYIALTLAVIFGASYLYLKHVYKHWRKRGVHYMEPSLFVGNLGRVFLRKESLVDLFARAYAGAAGWKVVGIFFFHKPILVVRDLDVVRSVLVKDAHVFLNRFFMPPEKFDPLFARSLVALKGRKWRHLRIKMTPTFTSGKMKRMFHLIEEKSAQLIECIQQHVADGRCVMVKDIMSRYTMDSITSCAFGMQANALQDPECKFITTMSKLFQPSGFQMLFGSLLIFVPWLQNFVSAKAFDVGITDFVRNTFWDVVEHRKSEGVVRKDFVDMLVQLHEVGEVRVEDAKDLEEITHDSRYFTMEHSRTDFSDINLGDDDIVAQAFIFIAGGFETSSSVLSFTLFELAMNLGVQEQLRVEVEHMLQKYDDQVTYDAIAEMTYLDMVVAEAMRKYAPLPFVDRECLADYTIEGTNITIEKGTVIMVPTNSIHYDPDIFPDPDKFEPERFSAENKANRSNFAYLPFGEGPRKCIGSRFGLLQVKTALVHVLKTYQVRPCKDTPHLPLQMKPFNGTLTPQQDIVLTFIKH